MRGSALKAVGAGKTMRIDNLLDLDGDDIVAPLRALATDPDRLTSARGRMLLELVEYLHAQGPAPRACGHLSLDELVLFPSHPSAKVSVQVWADWPDYGPARDGLPVMHYRLQIRRPGSPLSRDERAATPAEAERVIWQAFGWA
jgi:hypothetical protein